MRSDSGSITARDGSPQTVGQVWPKTSTRGSISLALSLIALLVCGTTTAVADVTHPFERTITPVGTPQQPAGLAPQAVDADGNIYIWVDSLHQLIRTDPQGNPVPFTDLGTNVIDGAGNNCPAVPADCDRVPTGGFSGQVSTNKTMVAVDDSNGPASGDIYVTNPVPSISGVAPTVEVFSPGGRFIGELDQAQVTPYDGTPVGVSVDANGHIYLVVQDTARTHHVDQFVATDSNPANDRFVGELQIANYGPDFGAGIPLGLEVAGGAASAHYTYAENSALLNGTCFCIPLWRKYAASEYFRPVSQLSIPVDFSQSNPPPYIPGHPSAGPFDDGGAAPCNGICGYDHIGIDQSTEDVYLMYDSSNIQEYDLNNHKLGPSFGHQSSGSESTSLASIAVDGSTTASTRGSVYVSGGDGNSVDVFGPPVPLPNVDYGQASPGHTTATVHATINLAGGPDVTECHVDYGINGPPERFDNTPYGSSVPCAEATPYSSDTAVSATLTGLNLDQTYHYRVVVTTANGTEPGADQTVHTAAVLGVSTESATDIGPTTATLHGSLNPDGIDTTVHFEYGLGTSYGHSTAAVSAGAGTGLAAVPPAVLANLQPGRIYHYRLVATNNLGTTAGADATFTAADSPGISGVNASNLSDTSADLNAVIDTFGTDTTYHFEYGLTPFYGTRAPSSDLDAGASNSPQHVSIHLSGLQSGVTYHYRLVAQNQWGTSYSDDTTFTFVPPNCPNEYVRQQTSANYLPDCRAYELVSPANASGIQLFTGNGVPNVQPLIDAGKGNASLNTGGVGNPARFGFYAALGNFPGTNAPDTFVDPYVATRTVDGWVTHYPGLTADKALFAGGSRCTPDLSQCYDFHFPDLEKDSYQYSDPSDVGSSVAYRWSADGSYLGRLPTNASSIPNADSYQGDHMANANFSHFVFSSLNVPFAPGGITTAPGSAYDNDTASGAVTVASLLANGNPIPNEFGNSSPIRIRGLSSDGSHILMSVGASASGGHLYMRVDDALTYDVSRGAQVTLVGMSHDGSSVFFTSASRLSPDDHDHSVDMYRWSETNDTLTLLSTGNGNGQSDSCNAQWTTGCSVVAVTSAADAAAGLPGLAQHISESDNSFADRSGDVYFYSPEQLDPVNPGIADEQNLYVYHNGQVQYVTTLDPGKPVDRIQVSPDGDHAAFLTASRLTAYDNAGFEEMYSYNAPTGKLQCVSCLPDGGPPSGDVRASASGLFMSDDGRTFFSTKDALVPQDTDGITDVYEFVAGRPQLISAGTGHVDSWGGGIAIFPRQVTGLEAVSHDGTDVYFSTFDTLVPQDKVGSFLKFYDARTNGGFVEPTTPLPCPAADECHGAGSSPPSLPSLVTNGSLGMGGNALSTSGSRRQPRHKHRRHKLKHRRGHRRGGAR